MGILVTGGFGFLGARITDHLVQCGFDVVVGSRFLTEQREDIFDEKALKLDFSSISKLQCALVGIDTIIHCAGANSLSCEQNPNAEIKNAKVHASNLLAASLCKNVKKIITISSVNVYDQSEGVKSETDEIFNNTPYALSKLAMEKAFLRNRDKRVEIVICRVSSSYGVPIFKRLNTTEGLINKFCSEAISRNQIHLKKPSLTRDFIPVENICVAVEKLIKTTLPNKPNEIINICSGQQLSLLQMASLIKSRCKFHFNRDPKIILGDTEHKKGPIYSNNFAASIGIEFDVDHKREIDKLLVYYWGNYDR